MVNILGVNISWIWIVVAIVVVIVLWGVGVYNKLVGLRNRVEEAFSTMDVVLQKRYDLIPNLVEAVKGYTKHEKETLDAVVRARSAAHGATTTEDKLKAEGELSNALGRLLMITEAYPELKANTNFLELQTDLKLMETEISSARKYYNGIVRMFNIKIESFPSNLIANMFNFKKRSLFEIEDASQRKNVKVDFS